MGGKRRWPRRLRVRADERLLAGVWMLANGYEPGARGVLLSAAEVRYLDKCRRIAEQPGVHTLDQCRAARTRRGR